MSTSREGTEALMPLGRVSCVSHAPDHRPPGRPAATGLLLVVAGFAAFLGKYLEQQFNLTTSSANQLLGESVSQSPGKSEGG